MRTMTVVGNGTVKKKPDYTVISLTQKSLDPDYETAVREAGEQLEALRGALSRVGFSKDDLKTNSFNVYSEYEGVNDEHGNYINRFKGYACVQGLSVAFDFDSKKLGETLSAIAGCVAEPELSIRFTVKDANAVNRELLKSAAENARERAEVLAAASGVRLGALESCSYRFGDREYASQTTYGMERPRLMKANAVMDFAPEEITASDEVTFVWNIE